VLYLLTATGARPAAWAICERLTAAQDYAGPVIWIIVDDGPEPQPVTFKRPDWEVVVIRPGPLWQPGQNTQGRNLRVGLACIPDDARVVCLEDDDYYAPGYLTAAHDWLENADLAGASTMRLFHVPNRVAHEAWMPRYAMLCSTVVKGPALAALRAVVEQDVPYFDIELWRSFQGAKQLHRTDLVVGIKGLPGRQGITRAHALEGAADADKLREWIGQDADLYLNEAKHDI
jgi:hypothetical protein